MTTFEIIGTAAGDLPTGPTGPVGTRGEAGVTGPATPGMSFQAGQTTVAQGSPVTVEWPAFPNAILGAQVSSPFGTPVGYEALTVSSMKLYWLAGGSGVVDWLVYGT